MKKFSVILKIIFTLAVIPLSFVKLFHDVGVLPNKDGAPVKVHYYYSLWDNLKAYDIDFLVPILIGLALLSVTFTVLSVFRSSKKIRITANIFSKAVGLAFIVLLTVASTVARGY